MFRHTKKYINLMTLLVVCFSWFLVTCDQKQTTALYSSEINTRQTMNWVLDPHADLIWDSSGFVVTAQGVQNLAPSTDEEWDAVRNAAASIVEAGNLLIHASSFSRQRCLDWPFSRAPVYWNGVTSGC